MDTTLRDILPGKVRTFLKLTLAEQFVDGYSEWLKLSDEDRPLPPAMLLDSEDVKA